MVKVPSKFARARLVPPMRSDTQSFERFELKYWAPAARVSKLMELATEFLREDERAGPAQVNTSLYFDSPRFLFLEQHLSGAPDRVKLRVRYYGDAPSGDCFFEIKRRQGAMVSKRRAVLSLAQARPLVSDVGGALPFENEALQTFQYLAQRCSARPQLLVRARRQSFGAADRSDVRLTIDHDVAWQPTRAPQYLEPDARRWRGLSGGEQRVLVEVKFHSARPWWLGHFTEQLAPWRVSFSKYVAAVLEARRDPFFTMDAA